MGVKALDQPCVVQGRQVQAQLVGVAGNRKLKVFYHSDPDCVSDFIPLDANRMS